MTTIDIEREKRARRKAAQARLEQRYRLGALVSFSSELSREFTRMCLMREACLRYAAPEAADAIEREFELIAADFENDVRHEVLGQGAASR